MDLLVLNNSAASSRFTLLPRCGSGLCISVLHLAVALSSRPFNRVLVRNLALIVSFHGLSIFGFPLNRTDCQKYHEAGQHHARFIGSSVAKQNKLCQARGRCHRHSRERGKDTASKHAKIAWGLGTIQVGRKGEHVVIPLHRAKASSVVENAKARCSFGLLAGGFS